MKNRLLLVMTWVIVLLWVYARNRMTREEYIEEEAERFRSDPTIQALNAAFEEELANDPAFKEHYYMTLYDSALDDVEME